MSNLTSVSQKLSFQDNGLGSEKPVEEVCMKPGDRGTPLLTGIYCYPTKIL